jgi:hypothetical protein
MVEPAASSGRRVLPDPWGIPRKLHLDEAGCRALVVSSGLKRSTDETGTHAERSRAEPGRRG